MPDDGGGADDDDRAMNAARHLVEDLEVEYLANHDRHLHFALLTDFPDAAQETMPTDAARLAGGEGGDRGAE